MKLAILAVAALIGTTAAASAQYYQYNQPQPGWQQPPPNEDGVLGYTERMQQTMQPPQYQPMQVPTQQYQRPMGCVPVAGGFVACR